MTVTVVQSIVNNGPSPGNQQLPDGLSITTPKPLTKGNVLVGVTTCATYGGKHTSWSCTDSLGNEFTNVTSCIGGQGNLSTDQQTDAWYAPIVTGGQDIISSKYVGGDLDWQAQLFFELAGVGALLDKRESTQSNIAPGNGVLNNGAPFVVTADMVPCYAIAFCQNISELGTGYTPTAGDAQQPLNHYGNFWTFPGDNSQNLPNLCVASLEITKPGSYTLPFNQQSTAAEDFQTLTLLFKDVSAAAAPVPTQVTLTAAEVAALAAGTPVSIPSPLITLVPPAAAAQPPAPSSTAPAFKVLIAQNGKVNPTWVEDYSYDATDVRMYQNTALPAGSQTGYGNEYAIQVTTTGPWGGFLPSNAPGAFTDFSACSEFTVAISAPKGNTYAMYAVMGGDVPINAPGFVFTKQADGYEVFTTPKSLITQDATRGDVSSKIYKMCIQSKQASAGDVFLVDNWLGI